jgi:hypothetical protein
VAAQFVVVGQAVDVTYKVPEGVDPLVGVMFAVITFVG